ncbi:uncharacterized protein ARMOST_20277 [Armillaria ostoyae]|uniref:Uncharacterized protein n=1 Tax=Armillaria ostoyae TaxID=47428 RepID=A0A284S6W9_ARMOS|nr:uncharacterized protein ARMOST_20277 [Armillaria ostoyae]
MTQKWSSVVHVSGAFVGLRRTNGTARCYISEDGRTFDIRTCFRYRCWMRTRSDAATNGSNLLRPSFLSSHRLFLHQDSTVGPSGRIAYLAINLQQVVLALWFRLLLHPYMASSESPSQDTSPSAKKWLGPEPEGPIVPRQDHLFHDITSMTPEELAKKPENSYSNLDSSKMVTGSVTESVESNISHPRREVSSDPSPGNGRM